jgi:pyruvate formate lyase activating enzyme
MTMKIGYLQKTSFIDYPGMISAVAFTIGCNFRCPFCHNPELVEGTLFPDMFPEDEVLSFMASRRGKLDALSITGGEPCLQPGLITFMKRVKDLGFLVKLDTNGSKPEVLARIMEQGAADYLAMDIKAPLEKYPASTACSTRIEDIRASIGLIMAGTIAYEFRTTLVDRLLTPDDVRDIGRMIEGSRKYVLQRYVPSKPLDPTYADAATFPEDQITMLVEELGGRVGSCSVR